MKLISPNKKRIVLTFFILIIQSSFYSANSQVELFKDILPGIDGSSPTYQATAGSLAFFSAYKTDTGIELWATDGTPGETKLVTDINPGPETSNIRSFVSFGDGVVFSADNGIIGDEPWYSDGTTTGTYLIADLNLGHNTSLPVFFIRFKNNVYFQALNVDASGNHGVELHRTLNLPPSTAEMFIDLNQGNASSLMYPGTPFAATGNNLFFRAKDGGSTGEELWVTNGSADSTKLVKDINLGAFSSSPLNLNSFGNLLFFIADDGISGYEPWISDGTEEGTFQLKDIYTGKDNGGNVSPPIQFNDKLFFAARDETHGTELWITDGTPAGTNLVKDIFPGNGSGLLGGFRGIIFKDLLFFLATDSIHGLELWTSDGTLNGTKLFYDINPGIGEIYTNYFFIYNDELFFAAGDVWATDGTIHGTRPVIDTSHFKIKNLPGQFFEVGGNLLFQADDGLTGPELWKYVPPKFKIFVPINGNARIDAGGNTGIAVTFSGISKNLQKADTSNASLSVERYTNGLNNVSGISEKNYSDYFWILRDNPKLNFAQTTSIHFLLSELHEINITNPSNVVVYYRNFPGGQEFIPLTTSYDSVNNEIIATGFDQLGQFVLASNDDLTTSVESNKTTVNNFELYQNYPNPFNPTTKIKYKIPKVVDANLHPQQTTLKVYDILGRVVATLVNKNQQAGTYEVEFNASSLPSGIYFYRLTSSAFSNTKKLVFIK